jgi:hypothetical protein
MSETHEIAEKITEAGEHEEHHGMSQEVFRRRMGMMIGFIACALAITAVGGSKAMQATINANIEATDDYAFYQSKVLRKQGLQTASDALDAYLLTSPGMSDDAKTSIRKKQEDYAKQMAHWDDAPAEGNGIKQLLTKAKEAQELREKAADRSEWFEFAEAMLQISVVIASTSVLLASRALAAICLLLAAVGAALSANGFLQIF